MDTSRGGEEADGRRTRSGRKTSLAGSKRTRNALEDGKEDGATKKKKMDPQLEHLKDFFSKELDKKLKENREEIGLR